MAVYRFIDGCLYEGNKADWVEVKAYDFGNGHLEVTGHRPTVWSELPLHPAVIDDMRAVFDAHKASLEGQQAAKENSALKSAQRAKKRIRHACKSIGADTLLTLTYRANQDNLPLCKKHLKEFIRRVKRIIPDFRAVCGFEQQKRGAWHVHIATNRLLPVYVSGGSSWRSFDLLRAVWRSVVGDLGGNVDVSARKRSSKRSPASVAAYLSKYLTKAFSHGEAWSNRWTRFGEMELPKPVSLGSWPDMRSAITDSFGLLMSGQTVASLGVNKWSDCFFVFFEGNPQNGSDRLRPC